MQTQHSETPTMVIIVDDDRRVWTAKKSWRPAFEELSWLFVERVTCSRCGRHFVRLWRPEGRTYSEYSHYGGECEECSIPREIMEVGR